MTNLEIQEKAEEVAQKYRTMRYDLGSVKKYSTIEWIEEMNKFLDPLKEPYKTKVREKFLTLIQFTDYKFLRDFPG